MLFEADMSGIWSRRSSLRLPKRKCFPVGGRSHAAKDERRRGFEQGATTLFLAREYLPFL